MQESQNKVEMYKCHDNSISRSFHGSSQSLAISWSRRQGGRQGQRQGQHNCRLWRSWEVENFQMFVECHSDHGELNVRKALGQNFQYWNHSIKNSNWFYIMVFQNDQIFWALHTYMYQILELRRNIKKWLFAPHFFTCVSLVSNWVNVNFCYYRFLQTLSGQGR